ncbi:hypothetical protein GALL_254170 [mine drainage metagenome]|uniref:Porin domain-containing protein n=1 Tax=mine drainage metagenome TaxID=410659 RepID=A0A1J5RL22_9ZZZZ
MQKKVKTKFGLSMVALSLGFAPALAHADTNAQILKELKALQAQVEQLQAKVQAQDAQLKAQDATVQAQGATLKAQQGQVAGAAAAADDASTQADHNAVQITGLKGAAKRTGMDGMTVTGMIAPAYVYNQDRQTSSFVFLNRSNASAGGATIYNYDNSSFGMANIQFQKVMSDGTKWTLNLVPDRGAGSVMNGSSIINEASVSMPINGDSDTRFIAGQIPDWEGYEYVFDNQTYAVTHNLLYDFTELTAYTGAGVDVTNGNLEWKALLANVNSPRYYYNNAGIGGRAPALVARFDYSLPGYDSAGVGGWALVGKLPNSSTAVPNGASTATMAELDTYLNKGAWGWYGQIGYGKQAQAAYNGGDAKWWGASATATYNFTPRLLGFARADYLNDSTNGGGLPGGWLYQFADSVNGLGPDQNCLAAGNTNCSGVNRYALSVGTDYQISKSTKLKLEYRYDGANGAVFQKGPDSNPTYVKNNSLIAAGLAVNF